MKSGTEVTKDVRSLINIPEVLNNITGKIHQYVLTSKGQIDIVVACFTVSNQQIQNATVNVNIHCPMLSIELEGASPRQQTLVPDLRTFSRVAALILPYLDCQWKTDFNTEVESTGIPIRDADGTYFYNIRVKYRSLQTNYKNI